MIRHIVTIRFRDDAPKATAREVAEALNALADLIPAIETIRAGVDLFDAPGRFHVGLVVEVANHDALEAYRMHPAHRQVVDERIHPWLDMITAVDHEL